MHYVHVKIDASELYNAKDAADRLLKEFAHQTSLTVFLDHTWEGILPKVTAIERINRISMVIAQLQDQKSDVKIFLLLNTWWKHFHPEVIRLPVTDVFYIDYFLYRTYREVIEFKQCASAYRWPQDETKFLFLTGVIGKLHRVRLLSKLVDQGLIEHCQWSLRSTKTDSITRARIHQCVPEMTVEELDEFLLKYRRFPDEIYANTSRHRNGGYGGLPYDVTLYTKTKFSLISESRFDSVDRPWITEKTWKAILNNHPFIMAGDTNTLCELHRKGFVTFEQFLPCKNYDTISDPEARLDAIVENVKYWVENLSSYAEEINRCVIHNRKLLDDLYLTNLNNIKEFINKHQFSLTVDDVIPTSRHHVRLYDDLILEEKIRDREHFCAFYNSIKDDNWPQCTTEEDFENLPESIKNECKDVFGYVEIAK
jgi:hypothetical protein